MENEADLDNKIQEIVKEISTAGPNSVQNAKQLIRDMSNNGQGLNLLKAKEDLASRIARARVSEEGQEGLESFLSKKKPSWFPQ